MKYRYAIPLYLICFVLQGTVCSIWTIKDVSVDLLLMLSMMVPLCYGGVQGCVLGAVFGLWKDVCFSSVVGPSAVLYPVLALAMLLIRVVLYGEKSFTLPLVISGGTAFFAAAHWGLLRLAGVRYAFSILVKRFPILWLLELAVALLFYFTIGKRSFRYPREERLRI